MQQTVNHTYKEFMAFASAHAGYKQNIRALVSNVKGGLTLTLVHGNSLIETYVHPGTDDFSDFETNVKPQLKSPFTNEGDNKFVKGFSGPSATHLWVQSIKGRMKRDGSAAYQGTKPTIVTKLKEDKTAAATDAEAYWYHTSFYLLMDKDTGLQGVNATWRRCNEEDHIEVLVEAPSADAFGNVTWSVIGQFAKEVEVFGDNPAGTPYPPELSPSLSWVPANCRVRLDFFKKAANDPEYTFTTGQDEATNPEKRGPYIGLDLLAQRNR